MIHPTAIVEPNVQLGDLSHLEPYAILGDESHSEVVIGPQAFIGRFAMIRGDVQTGHHLRLGSYSSIEGHVRIGNNVTIRGGCEIPSCTIGDRVSIYAKSMFYDSPSIVSGGALNPPVIEDDVTLACDVRVLGGVTIGARSFVCAGAFIQENVPPDSYVKRDGTWVQRIPTL